MLEPIFALVLILTPGLNSGADLSCYALPDTEGCEKWSYPSGADSSL